MRQSPGRLGFTEETPFDLLQFLLGFVQLVEAHGFDGDEALDGRIFTEIDEAHGAAAQLLEDLVPPESGRRLPVNDDRLIFVGRLGGDFLAGVKGGWLLRDGEARRVALGRRRSEGIAQRFQMAKPCNGQPKAAGQQRNRVALYEQCWTDLVDER
jgi:hypothetical protein